MKRQQGFVVIEFPLMLLILCLIGLGAATTKTLVTGTALPWYEWIAAALALPAVVLALGCILALFDPLKTPRKQPRQQRDDEVE